MTAALSAVGAFVHLVTRRYQSLTEGYPSHHYSELNGPQGLNHTLLEGYKMKKVLALVVAATMGLSAAAFAADTTAAPATATAAPAKAHTAQTTHKKKHANVEQKAQAAKKHHKQAAVKPASEPAAQKAQAAKKHHKKAAHKAAAKPATQPAA